MDELHAQLVSLIRSFHKLAGLVTNRHGGIIFEWPTHSKLWQEQTVHDVISSYGLAKVGLSVCRLGLCTKKGKAICKPWTFATNMQCVVDALSGLRGGRDHQHAVCAGEELRRTESYTLEMCGLLHQCLSAFAQKPILVAAAAAVPVVSDKVQAKQGDAPATAHEKQCR